MLVSLLLFTLSTISSASVVQHPLQEPKAIISHGRDTVTSSSLQQHISAANLLKRAEELYKIAELSIDEYDHPTRVIRSKGHLGTVSYIYSTIASLGDYYTISNQSLHTIFGRVNHYRLDLGGRRPDSVTAMSMTPPTPNKDFVFGPLVLVLNAGCDQSDYSSQIPGSIALIKRGACSFGEKSALAGKAGAIAAVIYNNVEGSLGGTLGSPSKHHIPTFGMSDSDAKPYIEALEDGEIIPASALVDSEVENIKITNIIAQTRGGDQDNCVMLGGHSDSVTEGPGINDDGSGTLTLLEIATYLSKYDVNNCVRFAWWAGEEEGLLGSDYYVSQLSWDENVKIRLFMDYDMLASPNFAYQIYNATDDSSPVGSQELRDLYMKFYEQNGLNYTFIPFDGRSDYDGFIKHGIPAGGIATGAEGVKTRQEVEMFGGRAGEWYDKCYHQLCDDISNLAVDAWVVNTKLVAHSVATYAQSFNGFPERTKLQDLEFREPSRYHGPRLVM